MQGFFVRFEVAEHRGAFWKEYSGFSRFMRFVLFCPDAPIPPMRDIADNGLPALTDGRSFADMATERRAEGEKS